MTVSTDHPRIRRRQSKGKLWPWFLVGALVLLVVGFVVAKLAIDSYLKSDRFREFVGHKTGETVHAHVEVMPFQFTGSTIYCDGLKSQGTAASAFSALDLDQIRIEISARRFFEHVWQVDHVEVQRARLDLGGPRLPEETQPTPAKDAQAEGGHSSPWLPNRVEIGAAAIHSVDLAWKDGGVRDTALDVTQKEGGWYMVASGGSVRQATLPTLNLESAHVLYRAPSLFIQSATLREFGGGTIDATGEAQIGDHVDLLVRINRIPVDPLLESDWRAKLTGNLNGEIHIKSRLPIEDGPTLNGAVSLSDGRLEALPVLDNIANLTHTERYRRLSLTNTSGDFERDARHLSVKNFVMESKGLIRIEGAFTVQNDMIDGDFQVGVTPSTLDTIIGSKEKVFTVARAGYLWAPMHLSGPVSKPKEDLSPRLEAAAMGVIFDTAKGAVQGILDKAKDPNVQKNATDAAQQLQKAADQGLKMIFGN